MTSLSSADADLRFERATFPPQAFRYEHYMTSFGLSKARAKQAVKRLKEERVWLSHTHQVSETRLDSPGFGTGVWLSIKQVDKAPIIDRDLLGDILRSICPGYCGFELLPSPTRLVDTANQYHVWGYPQIRCDELSKLQAPAENDVVEWSSSWTLGGLSVEVSRRVSDDWRALYDDKEKRWPGQEAAVYFDSQKGRGADGCVLVLPRRENEVAFFPFGFQERLLMDSGAMPLGNARQRPLAAGYTRDRS